MSNPTIPVEVVMYVHRSQSRLLIQYTHETQWRVCVGSEEWQGIHLADSLTCAAAYCREQLADGQPSMLALVAPQLSREAYAYLYRQQVELTITSLPFDRWRVRTLVGTSITEQWEGRDLAELFRMADMHCASRFAELSVSAGWSKRKRSTRAKS